MSSGELVGVALAAMGAFGALSMTIYAHLPKAAFRLAEQHGRYAGLGTGDSRTDPISGNRPLVTVRSLRGHSA